MPLISVVSPIYKASGCIDELCARLTKVLSELTDDYEIILVEDGSPDESWHKMQAIAAKNPKVHSLKLSRNFGQHYAITAGLDVADGDWIVVMDCDLQDPPEQIKQLYDIAVKGNHPIVVASFVERSESLRKRFVSGCFWRLLSWLAGINFDPKIGNFRIISRQVALDFRAYREQLRFFGGILSLTGYPIVELPMKREERFEGKSSYNLKRLMKISVDIIMAYSYKPLRISMAFGLLTAFLSFLVGLVIFSLALLGYLKVPGWASVMISVYLIGGVIIFNLGLLGYYLGRTFDEVKKRPLYVLDQAKSKKAITLGVDRFSRPLSGDSQL
jgi:glycosyltransferase involved in cell wall biosynthesis